MKNVPTVAIFAALSPAVALLATPVLAQQTPHDSTISPVVTEQLQTDLLAKANPINQTLGLTGKPVWSSDLKELGTISKVNIGLNGEVESINVRVGTIFGFGGKTVMIKAAEFSQNNDRIELILSAEDAKALPEIKA